MLDHIFRYDAILAAAPAARGPEDIVVRGIVSHQDLPRGDDHGESHQ